MERAFAHTGRRFAGKSIVIVGDSVHDVACGRTLGVRAVAVATGITSLERLGRGVARRDARGLRGHRAALWGQFSDEASVPASPPR